jgi:cytidine deaminase
VLYEFGGPGFAVIAESADGSRRRSWSLEQLLPDAFGPDDLDR